MMTLATQVMQVFDGCHNEQKTWLWEYADDDDSHLLGITCNVNYLLSVQIDSWA